MRLSVSSLSLVKLHWVLLCILSIFFLLNLFLSHYFELLLKDMFFNQTGDISTLDGNSLEQVDKFLNLGSCVSSTEKDIDSRLMKAWTAIDKLSIIWKSVPVV